MKYAIFLDICKFSHIASTKEDKSNEGEPMDGNLKQNNVVRGLQFERVIKFENAKQFFKNLLIEAIETLMKSKVTPRMYFWIQSPPTI